MKRCRVLLGCALLALPGCGGGAEAGTLPRERFVAANVALRTAKFPQAASAVMPRDSAKARADSARIRAEVLRKQGVTVKELQAFVEARRHDTEALAKVWEEIAAGVARADSIAKKGPGRDSARAPAPAPAPPPPVPPERDGRPRGMPKRPPPGASGHS